jgi:hypothetical protein
MKTRLFHARTAHGRMTSLALPVAMVATLLAACAKEKPAAPPATQTVAIEGFAEEPAKPPTPRLPTATKFEITPQTVRRGQAATVTVAARDLRPGSELTLSWFKPDGWNLTDQMVSGASGTLEAPVAQMTQAGLYRVELRSGHIHLGEATLTVTE